MDIQQVLELLLARMDADREERKTDEDFLAKMDANQEKAEADKKASQEKVEDDRKIDKEERKAAQAKADADRVQIQEMMKMLHANQAKAETCHKDFLARMDTHWKAWREIMNANHEEMMACQEMEAHQEEKPTSLDRKPEVAE
jgi:hypothetical protein